MKTDNDVYIPLITNTAIYLYFMMKTKYTNVPMVRIVVLCYYSVFECCSLPCVLILSFKEASLIILVN